MTAKLFSNAYFYFYYRFIFNDGINLCCIKQKTVGLLFYTKIRMFFKLHKLLCSFFV